MELLQGAKNKTHHKHTKNFIYEFEFYILPFTENIGHLAHELSDILESKTVSFDNGVINQQSKLTALNSMLKLMLQYLCGTICTFSKYESRRCYYCCYNSRK